MSEVIQLNEETFVSEVENSNEVVVVDFFATWCKPCSMLSTKLEEFAQTSDTKVFKVDVDECKDLAKKFGIRNLPTMIVFKAGKVAEQKVGLTNLSGIKELVEKVK